MSILRKDAISQYPDLDLGCIQSLIAQTTPHIDFSDRITPYNGNKDWEESCKTTMWWGREYTGPVDDKCKPTLALKQLILNCGGCEVCLPAIEEDLIDIVNHGQLWDNVTVKMMKGRPSQCHANAAELWYNNKDSWKNKNFAVIICTGYALSEDGIWRQHSWLIQAKPRANVIVETTEPRIAYYGFGMTYKMAEDFEYENS